MKPLYTLFAAIILQACSSEQPIAPSRPPVPPPVTNPDGGGGGDGGTDPQSNCFDASATKPTEPGQFLNQCNSTECFKFDNATRIEGFQAGAPLPPLN